MSNKTLHPAVIRIRRRSGKPTTRPRQKSGSTVSKQYLNGGRIECPSDPPSLNLQPWQRIVVQCSDGTKDFNAKAIIHRLRNQLDPEPRRTFVNEPKLQVKIDSVFAWSIKGQTFGVVACDFIGTKTKEVFEHLATFIDTGTGGTIPHIAYRWPLGHRQVAFCIDNVESDNLIFKILSTDTILIHIHVDWKIIAPTSLPKSLFYYNVRDDATSRNLWSINNHLLDQAITINEVRAGMEKIYDQMPMKLLGAACVTVVGEDAPGKSEKDEPETPAGTIPQLDHSGSSSKTTGSSIAVISESIESLTERLKRLESIVNCDRFSASDFNDV